VLQVKLSNVTTNKNNVGHLHLSRINVGHQQLNIFVSETLGKRINKARKAAGLTLKDLGKKIGRSHATLSQIENDVHIPEKATQIALARELNSNFGEEWLNEYLTPSDTTSSKKEIVQDMTVKEFVSLKFGGKNTRRSKQELDMLTKLLDAEIERMKNEDDDD
jgi:transcriptional regulator with XRE-family HTH domain